MTLGAVGVVYGDIGTSPLYALKQVFANGHVPLTAHNIYGVLSLVFWTLTVVVSVKYVVLILRADNNGEGGLIAMLALASQAVKDRPTLRGRLLFLGIFGTAIFFGDGVITPAISVLSAVEGLEVAAPGLHSYVVPLTLVVLTLLFGLVSVLLGSLWGEAWVILGLVGALASFVGGHFFLRPMGEAAARLIADGRIAGTVSPPASGKIVPPPFATSLRYMRSVPTLCPPRRKWRALVGFSGPK